MRIYIILLLVVCFCVPVAAIASDGEIKLNTEQVSTHLSEVRKFILLNYFHIANELVFGEDQYISALLEMTKTKPSQRMQTIAAMRKILAQQKSIYLFANEITQNIH